LRKIASTTSRRARLCPPLACAFVCALAFGASAQSPAARTKAGDAPAPALTRTTTRRETRRFGYGNTLTIVGAPVGSITVEAWPRAEIEVTADVELRADTEEDLALLAGVNTFLLDAEGTHFSLLTTGTHDVKFMKKAKNFPKRLLAMPWRIDYHVRVPAVVDLDVSAGSGALSFGGFEGSLQLRGGECNASFSLAGGDVTATLKMVRGTVTVALPANFNADIDATVLRAGDITGAHDSFAPRDDAAQTPRSWRVRAGGGGALLSFEVGDGAIRFAQLGPDKPKR
jgi:hypothetical protein